MKTSLINRDLFYDGISAWDEDTAISLIQRGFNMKDLYCKPDVKGGKKKTTCIQLPNKQWMIPTEYLSIDLHELFMTLVEDKGDIAHQRVLYELKLYDDMGFLDVLRVMCFIRDKFMDSNIVVGVGRGSSVSSYLLYLLEIHLIDSIKYNLDIHEFLKT